MIKGRGGGSLGFMLRMGNEVTSMHQGETIFSSEVAWEEQQLQENEDVKSGLQTT